MTLEIIERAEFVFGWSHLCHTWECVVQLVFFCEKSFVMGPGFNKNFIIKLPLKMVGNPITLVLSTDDNKPISQQSANG